MGIFSGAHADNSASLAARDKATANRTMQGSAQAISNYRIAQAQARQAALGNMMSLYNGPNDVLAGISGGRGADLSRAGYSPFAASTGYFNIGRATPYDAGYNRTGAGLSTTSSGNDITDVGGSGQFMTRYPNQQAPVTSAQFGSGGQIDLRQNGIGAPPPMQQNPFQFRPGGR